MSSPSIAVQYASIIAEWEASSQRKALLNVIQTKLLTLKTMHIESALCLGLGSLEHAKLFPRLKWPTPQADTQVNDTDIPESWEGDTSDKEPDIESCPSDSIKKTFRNQSLYQLVVFETTLECLREKLKIVDVYFQDPKFSKSDVTFLEQRGHKVLPYTLTPGEQSPIDPLMLKNVNSSTFLFAPALDIPVLVEVLCTRKPGLLLSEDPLECLAYPVVVNKLERGDVFMLETDATVAILSTTRL